MGSAEVAAERSAEVASREQLEAIRPVSPDEIRFFRDHGWVHLEQVLPRSVTDALLSAVQHHLGDAGDDPRYGSRGAKYTLWPQPSAEDLWVRSFSQSSELAGMVSALNRHPHLRWYVDSFIVKLGRASGGMETPWHQDFPQHAFDRAGMTTMWVPLVDCPPEMGTLRFLSGSRRAGPLGRYGTRADGGAARLAIEQANPGVFEQFEMSAPLALRVGDVTIHDGLTLHAAPANTTDSARWVYSTVWFPEDALYNGTRSWVTDELGLRVDEPFDDERFPVVTGSSTDRDHVT